MDTTKDYYKILGCSEDADLDVIKAVYHALARKHHPDANRGSAQSKAKFQELQEAYEILSNAVTRAYYDTMRVRNKGERPPGEEDENDDSEVGQRLQKDWSVVSSYYPDADAAARELMKISPNLGRAFKRTLLEQKTFGDFEKTAAQLEGAYLTKFFGQDQGIKAFARALLLNRNQERNAEALRELNKTVAILGRDLPAAAVIERIKHQYDLPSSWATASGNPTVGTKPIPNNRESWAVIRTLAEARGWILKSYFFAAKFRHLQTGAEVTALSPADALHRLEIKKEDFWTEMRSIRP